MPRTAGTIGNSPQAARRPRRKAGPCQSTDSRKLRNQIKQDDSLADEFDYDLLAMFVRNELAAQWTILLLALIFSLASMFWAPYQQAVGWLIIVVGAKVLLLDVCRRFSAMPPNRVDLKHWKRNLFIAEAVGGMTWAGFALVGIGNVDTTQLGTLFSSHVFLFASLIVILAIRMTFASTVPMILFVGTVPMTIAVVARLAMLGDFFYLALASMAVGVHIYFLFLAKGLRSTALAMLEFRKQKDLLIAELEEAKSISDQARRKAEEANQAKSQFLATMSHELRTPLNAILGFSEVMTNQIMGPLDNPTYREYTANIHSSGTHLLNLINEILDLSRIEAGKFELHEQAMDLRDTLDDCHRLMRLRAENKGLELIEDYAPGMATIWADERAIRQICLNLLTNAIKFTPRGGMITIKATTEADGSQVVRVIDTGPGIPKEELPKALSAFGQGSLAHKSAEGGTGLGLPIVQKLVELHGGTFELRSELRKGTEAIFKIPAARVLRKMEAVDGNAKEIKAIANRQTKPASQASRPDRKLRNRRPEVASAEASRPLRSPRPSRLVGPARARQRPIPAHA